MSTNRVLAFLRPRECRCCHQREELQRKLNAAEEVCVEIEADSGNVLEFIVPTVESYLRELKAECDNDDSIGFRFYVSLEARRVTVDEDLRRYTIDELRRIGAALLDAADLVEGGAA